MKRNWAVIDSRTDEIVAVIEDCGPWYPPAKARAFGYARIMEPFADCYQYMTLAEAEERGRAAARN